MMNRFGILIQFNEKSFRFAARWPTIETLAARVKKLATETVYNLAAALFPLPQVAAA